MEPHVVEEVSEASLYIAFYAHMAYMSSRPRWNSDAIVSSEQKLFWALRLFDVIQNGATLEEPYCKKIFLPDPPSSSLPPSPASGCLLPLRFLLLATALRAGATVIVVVIVCGRESRAGLHDKSVADLRR